MLQDRISQRLVTHGLTARLHVLGTSRNFSQDRNSSKHENNRFRLTQKLIKPSNNKKIKSQAMSPDQVRIHNIGEGLNHKILRKNLTHRTSQSSNQNNDRHFNFNPDFKFHVQSNGRAAALSNHSPDKIKIKTSGLVIDTMPTSVEKSSSKSKYVIHSTRKFSLSNQLKQRVQSKIQQMDKKQKQANMNNQLTPFETEQLKKFHLYFKGNRRINNKSQFTDGQGHPLIQKGDAIAYRYEILQQLGKGAFGKVYRSKDHKKNQIVALKIIRAIPKLNKQAKIEIQILQKAIQKDPQSKNNIVRMKGSFVFRSHSCITYQLLSLNLYQYLKSNKFSSTPEPIMVKFSIQILHAMNFLANEKVVHCDIKPQNIMLKSPHKTGVRLIDLGSSCYEDQQFYTYIQSRYYRAPEVILGIKYTTAIDMWSFGCVLAELYTGYPLFPGENEDQQLLMYIQLLGYPPNSIIQLGSRRKRFFNDHYQCRIIQSSGKYRMPKGVTFQKILQNCQDKLFVDFLKQCIQWEPSKRITPKQALLHKWILQGIPPNIRARHIVEVTGEGVQF